MAQMGRINDLAGLCARIAQLEEEVAHLRQDAEARVQAHDKREADLSEARASQVISGLAAAADRREIVAGWASLAESRTETREIGLALAELEAIYQVMPAGLAVIDSELRYVRVNDALARMNGVPVNEHIGRTIREVVPEVAASIETALRRVLETGEPAETLEFEAPTPGSDGTARVWLDHVVPLKDAQGRPHFALVTVLDITDRRRIDEKLRQSEARFRAAVLAVSGVIWTNTADGRMEGEQPGWSALTGQTLAEYQGFGWADAVHPEDAQATVDAWGAAVAERKTFIFEHRLRCADGRWRRFAIRAIPVLREDGTAREWVGVHTDVTEQREAEAVLTRDKADLERLVELRTATLLREVEERRRAEDVLRQGEKLQAIGQLTGGIAHDFANILQIVASGTALLDNPKLTEERRTAVLSGMNDAVESARELTSRLLSFARRQALRLETSDLVQRLQGMSDLLRHTLGSRIRVETDFAADTWLAHTDQSQLEVAVLNLALNARDAMLPEGGTLFLRTRNAHLEATPERVAGEYVCLAVKDTGSGIPSAVLARVFEPFFTTKGPDKGTGLGLAQVHGFARQSGGDMAIASMPGQGTTVTLHLPRAMTAQIETPPTRAEKPAGAGMVRTAGRTVLVVDDNKDVASFTAIMLEGLGYTTCRAYNAAQALALIGAGNEIDAVFSDVVMPGEIDGAQLASILHLRHPGLAVVLATGYSEVLADWNGRTVAEVLRKPYRLDEVAAALDRAFAAVQSGAARQMG